MGLTWHVELTNKWKEELALRVSTYLPYGRNGRQQSPALSFLQCLGRCLVKFFLPPEACLHLEVRDPLFQWQAILLTIVVFCIGNQDIVVLQQVPRRRFLCLLLAVVYFTVQYECGFGRRQKRHFICPPALHPCIGSMRSLFHRPAIKNCSSSPSIYYIRYRSKQSVLLPVCLSARP